jgi:hypothetical protein
VDTRNKLEDRFLCHLVAAAYTSDLVKQFFDREVSNPQAPKATNISSLFALHCAANMWIRSVSAFTWVMAATTPNPLATEAGKRKFPDCPPGAEEAIKMFFNPANFSNIFSATKMPGMPHE